MVAGGYTAYPCRSLRPAPPREGAVLTEAGPVGRGVEDRGDGQRVSSSHSLASRRTVVTVSPLDAAVSVVCG